MKQFGERHTCQIRFEQGWDRHMIVIWLQFKGESRCGSSTTRLPVSPDTLARASTRLDNWDDCIRQVHDVLALHAERLGQEPSSKIGNSFKGLKHIVRRLFSSAHIVTLCFAIGLIFRPIMLLALLHPFLRSERSRRKVKEQAASHKKNVTRASNSPYPSQTVV